MIKWIDGNPVALVLASVCGGLLVISMILGVVWSLPPSASRSDSDSDTVAPALDVPELAVSEPIDAYAVITERPVFNQSRQPVLEDDSASEDEDDLLAEEVEAPDVELAGVVITPSIRMVTLRSKDQPQSLVAFEGQPLEGNYGSWHVSRIQPREITLSSGDGEEIQLKLQVHDMTIATPPPVEPKPSDEPATADQAPGGETDQPLSRAEEIRQRIAQRREELRRAAEEQSEGQEDTMDYRTAIQSMINKRGRQEKQKQDENER